MRKRQKSSHYERQVASDHETGCTEISQIRSGGFAKAVVWRATGPGDVPAQNGVRNHAREDGSEMRDLNWRGYPFQSQWKKRQVLARFCDGGG